MNGSVQSVSIGICFIVMTVAGKYISVGIGIIKTLQKRNGKMSKDYNGYENGEVVRTGPSYQRGGYEKYNWCGRCNKVWDKTHKICGEGCYNRLRFKARYLSRRQREANGLR